MVDYRFSKNPESFRPAVIVRVVNAKDNVVNLQVFSDGDNDVAIAPDANANEGTLWRTSVEYSDDAVAGTWGWPLRV